MTTDAGARVPSPFDDPIAAAAAAAPHDISAMSKAERMKHHRKALRSIFVEEGMQGVKAYKRMHDEAASIRINYDAIAYSPKPQGYDAYLVELAGKWLIDDAALGRTNKADVERLNNHFGTSYPPAKHFSEPLREARLKKIKEKFLIRGAYLDTSKDNTMSKVRKAAKAFKGRDQASQPRGQLWTISGDNLIIGNRSFVLEKNGDRPCIRVSIDGLRRRFYLTDIEWLADLLGDHRPDPLSDTDEVARTTTTCSIGELDYRSKPTQNQQNHGPEISALAYGGLGLAKRIAALKTAQQPHSTTLPDESDPLNP